MPKQPLSYLRPQSMDEALAQLAQPDTVPLGGGTQLLASEDGVTAVTLVDLQALGLNQIERTADSLIIGATATVTALLAFLAQEPPSAQSDLLQRALRFAGPNTYRNAATLGGIIASRLPESELLAALLVLDATVTLEAGPASEMALTDYLTAESNPTGLITAVTLAWGSGRGGSERVARTPQDSPIVSVTWWQPDDGAARLAATGLGPRPQRLTAAEDALASGPDAAAEAATAANSHPGDFRGSAAYRGEMAAVLLRRLLSDAA